MLGRIALEPDLKDEEAFKKFARNMCIIAARRMSWTAESLKGSPETVEVFHGHLEAHYGLLKEAKVPQSVITAHAHKFTLWQVGTILKEATTQFGSDPESKDLIRTAAGLVFQKKYSSIAEAKDAYETALREATAQFGSDPESKDLIRTAAYLVFQKTYSSIAEAKKGFEAGEF